MHTDKNGTWYKLCFSHSCHKKMLYMQIDVVPVTHILETISGAIIETPRTVLFYLKRPLVPPVRPSPVNITVVAIPIFF